MDGYLHPKNINYGPTPQGTGYLYPRKQDEGTRPIPLPRQPRYVNTEEGGWGEGRGRQEGKGGYLNPTLTEYNPAPSSHPSPPIDIHPPGTKTRFDSGVSDLEMQGLSTSTSPRRSMAYEYMDTDNHYEEVPTLQRGSVPPSLPPSSPSRGQRSPVRGQSSPAIDQRSPDSRPTQLSGVTEGASDTEDGAAVTFRTSTGSTRRKITNPLYSRLISVASSIFSDSQSTKKVDTLERQVQCQCAVILILFIVTLGSMALSIYLMVGQSDSFVSNNELLMRVKRLEEDNKKFFQSSSVETNRTEYNLNQIYVNEREIKLKYNNLSLRLSAFSESVREQIANISMTPGPPGVGNLSACFYRNHTTSSQGSDLTSSSTKWLPDLADLSVYVVMSAVCSVSGGTSSNIKTTVHSHQWVQYQCRCGGAVSGESLRQCLIHLVLCPRYS